MAKKPVEGPRLDMPLRFEALGETEDGLRAMAVRMKAATAIWRVKERGDFGPALELLRDPGVSLPQPFRDFLAELVEGAHKRPEGRQAEHAKAMQRWEAARLFVVLTSKRGLGLPEWEAAPRLAEFYGVGLGTIREWLTKERARLGPAKLQEMEEQAGEALDFLLWAFPDNVGLRRLLK